MKIFSFHHDYLFKIRTSYYNNDNFEPYSKLLYYFHTNTICVENL